MSNSTTADAVVVPSRSWRWIKRLTLSLLLLIVVALLVIAAVLYTRPGLSLALSLANTFGGVVTQYESLDGSMASFNVKGLKVEVADAQVSADQLLLSWSPMQLFSMVIDVEQLTTSNLVVRLPPSTEIAEPTQPPNVSPPRSLDLPVEVLLRQLTMTNTQLLPAAGDPTVITRVHLQAALKSELWQLSQLDIELPGQQLSLNAQTTPAWPYTHQLTAAVTSTNEEAPLNLTWRTQGNIENSAGSLQGEQGELPINLSALTFGYTNQRWNLAVAGNAGPIELDLTTAVDGEQLFAAAVNITHPSITEMASARVQLDASGPFDQIDGQFQANVEGIEQLGPVNAQSHFVFAQFNQLNLSELEVTAADGHLGGDADLWLESPLRAEADLRIAAVNLTRLHPELTGTLGGTLKADTRLTDGEPETRLSVNLSSSGLTPAISLDGSLLLDGSTAQNGELRVDAGTDNQVQLMLSSPQQLSIDLALSRLQSLWPDLSGALSGQLTANPQQLIDSTERPAMLVESGLWPPVRGEISIRDAALGVHKIGSLQLVLAPDRSTVSLANLDLDAIDVKLTEFRLDGTPLNHQFDLSVSTNRGDVKLGGDGDWDNETYHFALASLSLAPTGLPMLSNEQTWRGSVSETAQKLERGCLTGTGINACLSASAASQTVALDADVNFSSDGLEALKWRTWWPGAPSGLQILAPVTLKASVAKDDLSDRINVDALFTGLEIPAPEGSRTSGQSQILRPLRDLHLVLEGSSRSADLNLTAGFADGTLEASGVLTQLLDNPVLDVTTQLNAEHLDMLSALLPDIDLKGGPLAVNIKAAGPASQPVVSGTAKVDQVTVAVPGLNISPVVDFSVDLPNSGAGTFRGTVVSGEGRGELSGSAQMGETLKVAVDLKGQRLLLANSDTLSLVASPDLSIQMDGALTRVKGEVVIDEGLIALTASSSGVQASPDVVIVDDETPADSVKRSGSELDVRVRIPDPLTVIGYGLKGEISGSLRVRQKPKAVMLGNGQLLLTGTYGAFGQKLTIERGALNYVETPLNDPAIDFFAYREVGDAKVGVRVTGRASSLSAELESDPPMNESDQLAMLVLGERNSGGGLDESQSDQLASAALGLALSQGNKRLGALGDSGSLPQVSLTQELGGLAVAIGKQISPNLYVGYTVDLLQPIQLIRLRYRISELWTAESELGQESRVAFRYRVER